MPETKQPENPFLGKDEGVTNGGSPDVVMTPTPSAQSASAGVGMRPAVTPSPATAVSTQTTSESSARIATERMLKLDERPWWRRPGVRWGGMGVLIFLIAVGVYWWYRSASVAESPIALTPSVTSPTPLPVATDPAPPVVLDDAALYRSENFKAGEIVLLGEAEFLLGDEGIAPLMLDGIRGEAFTEKNKQEVKLVIAWNTNKLAKAEVSYAKGIGQTPTVAETEDFAYDHSLILTGLDPASTYLYTIKATDRFGNIATSEPYAVFTGARSVSLFDLIAGAIGEVFGWAVK